LGEDKQIFRIELIRLKSLCLNAKALVWLILL